MLMDLSIMGSLSDTQKCATSFFGCLTVILLQIDALICVFSLRTRFIMWLLITIMCMSILCAVGAYEISIRMMFAPLFDENLNNITLYYIQYWVDTFSVLCHVLVLLCALALPFLWILL